MAERWRDFFPPDEVTLVDPVDVNRIKRQVPELFQASTTRVMAAWLMFSKEISEKNGKLEAVMPVNEGTADLFRSWLDFPI